MDRLFICIEAVNSNNPGEQGLYPYVEAPDFSIRLIAYSIDEKPAHVVDVAHGGILPREVVSAINDPRVIKTAYDGAFTRVCLSRYLCLPRYEYLSPENWECLMSSALYNGFPAEKDMLRSILGMHENPTGDMLCQVRRRINDLSAWKMNYVTERMWDLYKASLAAELENEISIALNLDRYPVPEFERRVYECCQMINDRGVITDSVFINQAIKRIGMWNICASDRFARLTGMRSVNPACFRDWLLENDVFVKSLSRKNLEEKLPTGMPDVDEAIDLWISLNRTNLNKYHQISKAVSRDSRLRGLYRYYGTKTGRFGSNTVQLDNLPVSILSNMNDMRQLTIDGTESDIWHSGYSIPVLYTELLSTAFVPGKNNKLIALTYDGLYRRVVSWLGEDTDSCDLCDEIGEYLRFSGRYDTLTIMRGIRIAIDAQRVSVRLPSGRSLYYSKPFFNKEHNLCCYCYDEHRVWKPAKLDALRILNDIAIAITRDILVDAMIRLEKAGFNIVMFFPGNVVIEAPEDTEFNDAADVFAASPEWAGSLRLGLHGSCYPAYLEISRDSMRCP